MAHGSPIPTVLSIHAEEAAFHWLLRDLATHEPHYSLKDLTELDDHLDAHLDGLRIAGRDGWAIVREELAWEEPGEVFSAALLAFEAAERPRIEEALEVATSSAELARGAISALGWLPLERAAPWIEGLLEAEEPMLRRIGIGGAAVHRHDPGEGLTDAIEAEEPAVRTRALQAAGELGRRDLLPHCQAVYDADDPDERLAAARSGALLGDASAADPLGALASTDHPRALEAADLATRRMALSRAHAWHEQLRKGDDHLRLAVAVAGATADPAVVPWLFEVMEVDELSRPAGEAFSMLTGVDLAYEDLERDRPEDFESGPTEDPEDEDVSLDGDEDLPWPDSDLLKGWWAEHGGAFSAGTRYFLGNPAAPEAFRTALAEGFQRQRNAAAIELALADPAAPLFETRAPGKRQRAAIGRP